MPEGLKVDKPCTLYIRFTDEMPKLFVFGTTDGDVTFFRYLNGKIPRIKFNVNAPGDYIGNVPIEITKQTDIEIPAISLPTLPPAERDRWTKPVFVDNPNLTETVARNFTDTGIIEHGPRYHQLIRPMQVFIDLHEMGHFFYSTEEYCDLYALVNFVRMGYNVSTAYYTMTMALKKSKQQVDRLKTMFDHISSIQDFNPGI